MENATKDNSRFSVTSSGLKWVALITMLIDHVGASILEWSITSGDYRIVDGNALYVLDMVFRAIGRTAFPLYIFLMAEGFYYTRSRKNYLIRLIIFCFISEVPFDMAFGFYQTGVGDARQNLWVPGYQNVFFTLALGLAAIWIMNLLYEKMPSVVWEIILDVGVVAVACLAAYALKTDYDAGGVLAICGAHVAKRFKAKPVIEGVMIIAILVVTAGVFEAAAAIIALPLLALYRGKRGYRFNRWIFYVFYPAHLCLLALIRTVVFAL